MELQTASVRQSRFELSVGGANSYSEFKSHSSLIPRQTLCDVEVGGYSSYWSDPHGWIRRHSRSEVAVGAAQQLAAHMLARRPSAAQKRCNAVNIAVV